MQTILTIPLSDSLTGFVWFQSRFNGVNHYEVGLRGSCRSVSVHWPDGGLPSCSMASEVGLSESQACLLARHWEEDNYRDYADHHQPDDGPLIPQDRGLDHPQC